MRGYAVGHKFKLPWAPACLDSIVILVVQTVLYENFHFEIA